MPARKNLFLIGRKGHEGDENQLTEMLAYLFQEERDLIPAWLSSLGLDADGVTGWEVETQRSVPGGFLDLVLYAPGQALVIVESKLGSTTDFDQITKCIRYANSVSVSGMKALIKAATVRCRGKGQISRPCGVRKGASGTARRARNLSGTSRPRQPGWTAHSLAGSSGANATRRSRRSSSSSAPWVCLCRSWPCARNASWANADSRTLAQTPSLRQV